MYKLFKEMFIGLVSLFHWLVWMAIMLGMAVAMWTNLKHRKDAKQQWVAEQKVEQKKQAADDIFVINDTMDEFAKVEDAMALLEATHTELEQLLLDWAEDITSLLTNDKGKHLANDATTADKFFRLYDEFETEKVTRLIERQRDWLVRCKANFRNVLGKYNPFSSLQVIEQFHWEAKGLLTLGKRNKETILRFPLSGTLAEVALEHDAAKIRLTHPTRRDLSENLIAEGERFEGKVSRPWKPVTKRGEDHSWPMTLIVSSRDGDLFEADGYYHGKDNDGAHIKLAGRIYAEGIKMVTVSVEEDRNTYDGVVWTGKFVEQRRLNGRWRHGTRAYDDNGEFSLKHVR